MVSMPKCDQVDLHWALTGLSIWDLYSTLYLLIAPLACFPSLCFQSNFHFHSFLIWSPGAILTFIWCLPFLSTSSFTSDVNFNVDLLYWRSSFSGEKSPNFQHPSCSVCSHSLFLFYIHCPTLPSSLISCVLYCVCSQLIDLSGSLWVACFRSIPLTFSFLLSWHILSFNHLEISSDLYLFILPWSSPQWLTSPTFHPDMCLLYTLSRTSLSLFSFQHWSFVSNSAFFSNLSP